MVERGTAVPAVKSRARYADRLLKHFSARWLYLSLGIEVNVVDADNGKLLRTISGTPGVHGTGEFKQLFTR